MAAPVGTTAPPQSKVMVPAMVDVAAAPVPNRSNPLRKPTSAEVKSNVNTGLGILGFAVVAGGLLLFFGFKVIGIAVLALLSLFGGACLAFRNDEVSACPFCGNALLYLPKANPTGPPRMAQCKKCWEYSGVQNGYVAPYNPNAVEESPTFRSPLAQRVLWPRGCVQCGAEPTRFDEVGTYNISAPFLVVGVARVKTFTLKGVPYCNAHKAAVVMKPGVGNNLYLDWRSLPMMRRYMAANRGRFAE